MTLSGTSVPILLGVLSLGAAVPGGAQENEERRVLAVAHAALAAITEEDMVGFADLMTEGAVTYSIGARGLQRRTREETRAGTTTQDYVERGFEGEVRIAGDLATVWLPYDFYVDGAWSHCGVDTFTLIRMDGEWRIAGMAWTVEQPPACRPHPDGPPGTP